MADFREIPAPILALAQNPPLLKGESLQHYNDLLGILVVETAPTDLVEWLWVLGFLDRAWDVLRIRRFKCALIDLQHKNAMRTIVLKMAPHGSGYTPSAFVEAEELWSADSAQFVKHGIDTSAVPAIAATQISKNLEALDQRMERAERRCDRIMQQLEYRRELFAHRARSVAGSVLKEETAQRPSLTSSESAVPLAPADQMVSDQIPTDEPTIVPPSPGSETQKPGAEETLAEMCQSPPLAPADQTAPDQEPTDQVTTLPTPSGAKVAMPSVEETSDAPSNS